MSETTDVTFTLVTRHASDASIIYDTFAPVIGDLTIDEWYKRKVEAPITTGADLDLTMFASVSHVVVHNTDGSNFVTLTWDDAAADTNTIVIAAGSFAVIPDLDPSATCNITADTAACYCDVFVCGS